MGDAAGQRGNKHLNLDPVKLGTMQKIHFKGKAVLILKMSDAIRQRKRRGEDEAAPPLILVKVKTPR